ncbi:LUD domain-containing protein [Marinobacterium sp. D7]|uniref:LutC/YkgG family protein n=1 Tax=Marinobacterium ramblicola TaxID=2849041 RepID=UPI001C2D0CA5|nr:LUD domain-containing protein [Marinobacterium ramblicola]MBV1787211.1 LUD domain-containing protein [Marinobacterium ramblicola]
MSRAEIFNRIRTGLRIGADDRQRQETVQQRLQARAANLIPQRAQLPQAACIQLFIEMAIESAAELIELRHRNELSAAVEHWLSENGISQLVLAREENLQNLDWSASSSLVREERVAQAGDEASLTNAFCGIAETGTLMLHSGPDSPTTLNFLPDNHLVALSASSIVGAYEEAWQQLRAASGGEMPRTVNMITGPSRSADIEQKLQMGAHGPRRLAIFLIRDE